MTFPRTDRPHPDQHPPAAHRPARITLDEDDRKLGRYLDALVFPQLPFGYGLTYTTFEYGDAPDERPDRALAGRRLGRASRSRSPTPATAPAGRSCSCTSATRSPQVTRPLVELADWAAARPRTGRDGTVTFTRARRRVRLLRPRQRPARRRRRDRPVAGPDALHGSQLTVTVDPDESAVRPAACPGSVPQRLSPQRKCHDPDPGQADPHRRRAQVVVMAGEVHYFRVARDEWEQRILAAQGGRLQRGRVLHPVAVARAARRHHRRHRARPAPSGTSRRSSTSAREHGLWFIARPGPFIMAELKNEGLPFRLYTEHPEIVPAGWDGRPAPTPDRRLPRAGLPGESASAGTPRSCRSSPPGCSRGAAT